MGDRFSFNGLHQYAGVDYQSQRDDPMLRQLNGMSAEACLVLMAQLEPAPTPPSVLEHSVSANAIQQATDHAAVGEPEGTASGNAEEATTTTAQSAEENAQEVTGA